MAWKINSEKAFFQVHAQAAGVKRARESKPKVGSEPVPKKKAKAKPSTSAGLTFKGYSIDEIPKEAHPQASKMNTGKHGYTVTASNNAATCFRFHNGFFSMFCFVKHVSNLKIWMYPNLGPVSKAIEVLLKNRAFCVKRIGNNAGEGFDHKKKGQYTWNVHGGIDKTWEIAKQAAFWPESD